MPDRRQFVLGGSVVGSVWLGGAATAGGRCFLPGVETASDQESKPVEQQETGKKKERPPRLELELVQEMVAKSHGDLERVKQLVADEPRLVNACHDWTAGDFETALGAASHTGSRDIALFLLENGARMDIFAATMLGHLEIVRTSLTAQPGLIDTPGPHGIPLIKHAEYGGEQAAEVLDYLKTLNS